MYQNASLKNQIFMVKGYINNYLLHFPASFYKLKKKTRKFLPSYTLYFSYWDKDSNKYYMILDSDFILKKARWKKVVKVKMRAEGSLLWWDHVGWAPDKRQELKICAEWVGEKEANHKGQVTWPSCSKSENEWKLILLPERLGLYSVTEFYYFLYSILYFMWNFHFEDKVRTKSLKNECFLLSILGLFLES